ncbi:polymorphic toxin-type HINT domain-containing protein [Gloeobacter violaceus]|uniref:polymorphic toxin-type HINT domain-containing protein n=1 Tax=Gloeobacter violaceus TaxID=33072 RepID=UPI0013E8AF55|nr:polymorphic toxin-type HINT domain-containing protein [Gloeobacter violaceus]
MQVLADVGGLIPDLNVPSAILGIGASVVLGDAAGALASGLALVPFGGFAKAGVGLFKARTGLSRGIVAASRACGCFAEGTEVQTETGTKAIEKVEPGEKVLARNEKTGEQNLRRVQSTFQFDDRPVYRLELRQTDGDGERDTLTVTGEHPFFLQGQGWTAADKLQAGDRVQAVDGRWLRVVGLAAQEQRQRTYNLEIEGEHTFFVGHNQAWVHNECISLYRAVLDKELQDIKSSGVFRNPYGIEIKYFSVTAEGAARYARSQFINRPFEGPYTLLRTRVPSSLLANPQVTRLILDRGIGGVDTVTIPTELLKNLSPPTMLRAAPLPSLK